MTKKNTVKEKNNLLLFLTKNLFLSFILLLCCCCENETKQNKNSLPYLGKPELTEVVYKLVNGKEVSDTIYPTIPDFTFMTHDSVMISSKSMKGKIWIADFFFTSCTTICPLMTKNMKFLVSSTKAYAEHLKFLSFTINPNYDSPTVLRRYRNKHQIKSDNWLFLRGNETETHQLGIDNFLVYANRDENSVDGFAHSGAFTLVDKNGYVRGVYLGTDKKEVKRLLKDLRILMKE